MELNEKSYKDISVIIIENGLEENKELTHASLVGFKQIVTCKNIPPCSQLTENWILIMGAGEIMSSALILYLETGAYQSESCVGIAFRHTLLNSSFKSLETSHQPRLIRKSQLHFVHAISERGNLKTTMHSPSDMRLLDKTIHICCNYTLQSCMDRIEYYAVEKVKNAPDRLTSFWSSCIFKPFGKAFHYYLLQQGFRYGKVGILWMVLGIYQHFFEYISYCQIKNNH